MRTFLLKSGSFVSEETEGRVINAKRDKGAALRIQSTRDLARLFPGKFEEMATVAAAPKKAKSAAAADEDENEDDAPVSVSAQADADAEDEGEEMAGLPENFNDMTVEELREFAADNEINLHGASTKKDIQRAIKDAVGS